MVAWPGSCLGGTEHAVGVIDHAAGQEADPQVERDLGDGADPQADADAHRQGGQDEDEPVKGGKWT